MGAREVSIKRFGWPTRLLENPVVAAVGLAQEVILRSNPDRVFWLVVNLSVNVIMLAFDSDVGPAKGIRLDANGGWASMAADEDGDVLEIEKA